MAIVVTQSDSWSGLRVLVTGHTGFKGAWLSLLVSRLGGAVTGFALPAETELGVFEAARVAQRVDSVLGDVRDPRSLHEVIDRCDPHVVFHLAAQPLVMRSYEDPVETLATNVMGTANLLESLRHRPNLRAVVVVTSDKCYENREWNWGYRETDRLGGLDPYSMSKACQEFVVSSYRRALFGSVDRSEVRLATARAGNVVGGGDWAEDRLVPDLIRAFVEGVPASIRNPESVRPWQHVLDPLAGYVGLAEHMLDHERLDASYNFGPPDNDRWPVMKVADLLRDQWGDSATWHSSPVRQPHEADLLHLDSSNARKDLGWMPKLSTGSALRWAVEWYKAQQSGLEMSEFTEQQVTAFLNDSISAETT